MSNDTRQALAERLKAWEELAEFANGGWDLPPVATEKLRNLCANARAALSAQPVAGAVREWDEFGRTNSGDETGGAVQRFGFDITGSKPDIIPATNGAFVYYSDYLTLHKKLAAPAPEPSRSQKMREAGFTARDTRLTCDECGAKFTRQFAQLHECAKPEPSKCHVCGATEWPCGEIDCPGRCRKPLAAPEPSAQAVAHPSHQTVREWMPVSEALRLSDLWTTGDLDNCGQWRAAIKVLADEVRALAASPQPEPSAQGEPVACDRDAPVCPWCDRQGWDICQHADDARTCGK